MCFNIVVRFAEVKMLQEVVGRIWDLNKNHFSKIYVTSISTKVSFAIDIGSNRRNRFPYWTQRTLDEICGGCHLLFIM